MQWPGRRCESGGKTHSRWARFRRCQSLAPARLLISPKGSAVVAQGIEYVELYASDQRAVLDYYTGSLGFTQIAESADNIKRSVLLRQGTVQVIVSAGPGTTDFLDAHGDGIADIALTCDDPAATADAAVAAGASEHSAVQGYPVVSGYAGISHTLLPMPADQGSRLPPGRSWTAAPAAPATQVGHIRLLDHVAICVQADALAEYVDFYESAFGLARYSSEYVGVGDQGMDQIVVRSPSGAVTFTIVAPDSDTTTGHLHAFLARNGGSGVQHLAFAVDYIVAAVRAFKGRGIEFLTVPESYYDQLPERLPAVAEEIANLRAMSVLADRDEWGYLLQLFTRSPYERNTLFYELIQRRGAHGFGIANIRALYEAVERDRLTAS
jgi:4-hydroxymandelate synthase